MCTILARTISAEGHNVCNITKGPYFSADNSLIDLYRRQAADNCIYRKILSVLTLQQAAAQTYTTVLWSYSHLRKSPYYNTLTKISVNDCREPVK